MSRPLMLALLIGLACGQAAAELVVTNPWIRETPPGRTVAAGYLQIDNTGAETRVLVGARSPEASRMELHSMRETDGMMRMRREDAVSIGPGASLSLAPGGWHLMLFDIDSAVAGNRIPVVLEFDGGEELELVFEVRRPTGGRGSAAARH